MAKIKAIIFDYGGVLSVEGSIIPFCGMYAPKFGADPGEFKKLFLSNWGKAKVNTMSSKLFWLNLSKFLKIDPKILRKDLMDFFGFRPEILDLIKKLKNNYKLGFLSNQIEDWLEEVIEKHKLDEIFDVIVTSYGSRKAKPDPEIYKEIIKKLNLKPEECIYIDDLERNMPPARQLGMKTILFKSPSQLKKDLNKLDIHI